MLGKAKYKVQLLIDLFENIDNLIFEIQQRDESKDLIINLNTDKQLYEGKTADEGELGTYSPFTVVIKKQKNQPSDRVTLKDTGDFYSSFKVTAKKNETIIFADTIKGDKDLEEVYGNILGLNEENLSIYREYIKKALLQLLCQNMGAIKG